MSFRFARLRSGLFAWGRPRRGRGTEAHGRPDPVGARERYHRALFLVVGFWALMTCAAGAVYPPAALVFAAAGLVHIVVGYQVEQKRRADERAPEGDQTV
ncbi:hypothetical protein Acsp06_51390 [Actinomycetospora sp. NBRC 106375]|uniref:hypothetical protein n=1 Tax=Actinomycetospora sp. NBRC 106375 TaxID=3032207 RepID=UPI0024A224FE|nr:hypothetical protein [Actinomycetospora sp. NBRC 106375]GLZ48954.1 hypothetical protein Acsp06_51390 [Actinomycetospora sp. NBRC 106375]